MPSTPSHPKDATTPNDRSTTKRLWATGISIFILLLIAGLLTSVDWPKQGISVPSLSGIDGTYVLQSQGQSASLTIHGDQFVCSLPSGYSENGRLERDGKTLRFIDGQVYKNGYLSPLDNNNASRVELGTLLNDGQTIEVKNDQGDAYDFVKQ